jgi:phosphoribosylformylglycinamidine cyclo-ligase
MHRVFNCGIGMVVIVAAEDFGRAQQALEREGESVFRIGEIRSRTGDEPQTVVL